MAQSPGIKAVVSASSGGREGRKEACSHQSEVSSSGLEGNLSSAGCNTDACQESKSEKMLTVGGGDDNVRQPATCSAAALDI